MGTAGPFFFSSVMNTEKLKIRSGVETLRETCHIDDY